MMKLYGYWRSTAAYRVRIALAIKNINVEQVTVNLVKGGGEQHQQQYRNLNPQGLVPALDVDGQVIAQSMAILEYLEERFPEPSILSGDLMLNAKIRAFSQSIVSDIHPLNNLRVLQYLKTSIDVSDEQKMKWYFHWIAMGFEALEKIITELGGHYPYCFGNEPSMADICLVPQIYNANRFDCPMENYPNLRRINEHCLHNEAFIQAIPENQMDAS